MQPKQQLHIPRSLWAELVAELHRRTEGRHESGAFLLGRKGNDGRRVSTLIFYDDLDPHAYESGVCILYADAFGRLWQRCASLGLSVVADVHVHLLGAGQSRSDRENPMIAISGHLALIFPGMARSPVDLNSVGIYEYLGDHRWRAHSALQDANVLNIEVDK